MSQTEKVGQQINNVPSPSIVTHPEPFQSPHTTLCSRVLMCHEDEYVPTHIILDSRDYCDDHQLIEEFRDIAFTWTRNRPRDFVPQYFFEITSDPSCTHVVWLSRKAMSYSDPLFAWVFAHELRHVYQSRHQFPRDEIQHAVRALRRKSEYINLGPSLFAPEDIDSELSALRVFRKLYGEDELNHFLASTPLPRCPYPAYSKLLHEAVSVIQE